MPKGKQRVTSLKSVSTLMTNDLLEFSSFLPLKANYVAAVTDGFLTSHNSRFHFQFAS